MGCIDFETVLARITCTTDDDVTNGLYRIEHQFLAGKTQHLLHGLLCIGSLNSNLSVEIRAVLKVYVEALGILLHPSPVLIYVGCIDNQEEVVLAHLVHQQVVHRAAVPVAHHTIIYFTCGRAGYVVGKDMLHVALGILTLNGYLAHVRDVKDAHFLAYSHVLECNAGILNGHFKTAKGRNQGTQCHMFFIKTSSLHFFCCLFKVFYLVDELLAPSAFLAL